MTLYGITMPEWVKYYNKAYLLEFKVIKKYYVVELGEFRAFVKQGSVL